MRERQSSLLAQWRRVTAALMIAVVGLVSFSLVVQRAALASSAPSHAGTLAGFSDLPMAPAKPCHKTVLPGVVNNCPLSGFGFSAVVAAGERLTPPAAIAAAWFLSDSWLPLQHSALGLYRPPRSRV